jgi:hypothetical protein
MKTKDVMIEESLKNVRSLDSRQAVIAVPEICKLLPPVVQGSSIDKSRLKAFLRKAELGQKDTSKLYYIEHNIIYRRGFLMDPKPVAVAENLKRITSILTRNSFTDPECFNPTQFEAVVQITKKFLLRRAYALFYTAAYEIKPFKPMKFSIDGKAQLAETVLYTINDESK